MKITKESLLSIAEIIDAFRIVPRLILGGYAVFVFWVVDWYIAISNPTTQQTALVTTVAGTLAAVIGLYQHTGRHWGPQRGGFGRPHRTVNITHERNPYSPTPPRLPPMSWGNDQQHGSGIYSNRTTAPSAAGQTYSDGD